MKQYHFGTWTEFDSPMTASQAAEICQLARTKARHFQHVPLDKRLSILEEVGQLWSNPNYIKRQQMLETLPTLTGFSREMINLGLDEIGALLKASLLRQKVETELKGLYRGGADSYVSTAQSHLRWAPLGTILHVLSGNVFLVGLGSLIEGVLTGNMTILKMASEETVFLPAFMESLQEIDSEGLVANSIAVVHYSSAQDDVIATFKDNVDGVLVWGGETAVNAYRQGLRADKKLIVFGPKLSFAVITEEGINHRGHDWIADKLAYEVSIWDQNACTAPQQVFVEGKHNAQALMAPLQRAMDRMAKEIPQGSVDVNTAVEIQKIRSVAQIASFRHEGELAVSKQGVQWTVYIDKNQTLEPSPLHRTVRLVPYSSKEDVLSQADSIRGFLQTVGIVATTHEKLQWYQDLAEAGALKVAELGMMGGGDIDEPHDGAYDLPQLGHFVVGKFEMQERWDRPVEFLPKPQWNDLINSRLRRLIENARLSPFYRDRLSGLKINSIDDLRRIPVLSREQMDANMPPHGNGLGTRAYSGGYVSRSGGSTGEPKFSIYDKHDWEAMINHAVGVFQSMGIIPGDRIANFMLAGDMYGSFVSFDHINYRLGATNFAFADKLDPERFLRTWREFGINVIEGIPARIMVIVKQAKEMDPDFTIEKIMYAGTPMSPTDYRWLKEYCGVKIIRSIIGANDGGQIAFQADDLEGKLHYTVDDFNYMEIVDDEGQPVADGTPGRILITSLLKFAFPLIRYEIGDAGRIRSDLGRDGKNNRVIEYLGRSDDTICVGLMNLPYRDWADSLVDYPVSALQLQIVTEKGCEAIRVNIESQESGATLADEIRTALLKALPRVQEGLDDKTLGSVTVHLHPIGSLERNPRSGKFRNIIDERT